MLDLIDIGEAVRRQRREMKLTQADLAARSGVSRSTINALEAGRLGEIGYRRLATVLSALGLQFRIAPQRHRRPTLQDLIEEDERDPGRGGQDSDAPGLDR